MPDPREYVALRSVAPVSRPSTGEPETDTGSVNVTLMWNVSPARYVPDRLGDETDTTTGRPCTSRAPSPAASRPSAPGSGRDRCAAWPSRTADMEPPLRDRDDADL